jgi:hypothetical protein
MATAMTRRRGEHRERGGDRLELSPNRSDHLVRGRVTALGDADVQGHRGTCIAPHREVDKRLDRRTARAIVGSRALPGGWREAWGRDGSIALPVGI